VFPVAEGEEVALRTVSRSTLAACGVLVVGLFGAGSAVSSIRAAAPGAFGWLVPAPAPVGWKHLSLPSGGAVLSYPPTLRPLKGDASSVSVVEKDRSGKYFAYLNSTSQQGDEHLSTWPSFRLTSLRGESELSVHEDAQKLGLSFRGGTGSCVIDDYVTRIHSNHYHEIACFVQGKTAASVIVAAATESNWPASAAELEQAVAAYQVN
jgi:hypothetical protein